MARLIGTLALMVVFVLVLLVGATVYVTRSLDDVDGTEAAAQPRQASAVDEPLRRELTDGAVDYVALGDSFSAGPGIATRREDPLACDRSTNNFPAYLAGWLDVASYTDVSCTGARTEHVLAPQERPDGTVVPPQADGLSGGTDLVTITLGGNDYELVQRLIGTCFELGPSDPGGTPCTDAFSDGTSNTLLADAAEVEDRLREVIRSVRLRASRAAVVVVGYPHLFPTEGTCPALGFAAGDTPFATDVVRAVSASAREAAAAEGVRFVDVQGVTADHDICAPDPWFAGAGPGPGGPAPWHATQEGMRQVARAVYAQLTGETAPDTESDATPPTAAVVTNPAS